MFIKPSLLLIFIVVDLLVYNLGINANIANAQTQIIPNGVGGYNVYGR